MNSFERGSAVAPDAIQVRAPVDDALHRNGRDSATALSPDERCASDCREAAWWLASAEAGFDSSSSVRHLMN